MTDGAPKAPLRQREALPDCGAKRRPVRPPEILISRNPSQHETIKHRPAETRTYLARHQDQLGSTATTRRVQEYWKTIHSDYLGSRKYWKTIHSDYLGIWEYLKAHCCLGAFAKECILGTWSWKKGQW